MPFRVLLKLQEQLHFLFRAIDLKFGFKVFIRNCLFPISPVGVTVFCYYSFSCNRDSYT